MFSTLFEAFTLRKRNRKEQELVRKRYKLANRQRKEFEDFFQNDDLVHVVKNEPFAFDALVGNISWLSGVNANSQTIAFANLEVRENYLKQIRSAIDQFEKAVRKYYENMPSSSLEFYGMKPLLERIAKDERFPSKKKRDFVPPIRHLNNILCTMLRDPNVIFSNTAMRSIKRNLEKI